MSQETIIMLILIPTLYLVYGAPLLWFYYEMKQLERCDIDLEEKTNE